MSDVIKTFSRSNTDFNFARSFSYERSQVNAPIVKLKYDVPKTPPHHIRYKRKAILQVPAEQKISHRYSLKLFKSNTFWHENSGKPVTIRKSLIVYGIFIFKMLSFF